MSNLKPLFELVALWRQEIRACCPPSMVMCSTCRQQKNDSHDLEKLLKEITEDLEQPQGE